MKKILREGSMFSAIEQAILKGYTIEDNGVIVGLKGKPLKIKLRGNQRYPTFSVKVEDLTKSGIYGIPVHKFAAHVFFGESAYQEGMVVRHLNGNTLDNSKRNLAMGTHSENNMDKPKADRVRAAKIARASQGPPANRKFSEDEIRDIRSRLKSGESQKDVSDFYSVTRQCINLIKKGRNYSDVE